MMGNRWYTILAAIWLMLTVSCKKKTEESLGMAGAVVGKAALVSYTNGTCNMTLRYAVAADGYGGALLPLPLFYIDTTAYLAGNPSSGYCGITMTDTKIVTDKIFPASIFVLIDKSVTSITEDFNNEQLIPFRESFFRHLLNDAQNCEVNFAMCAADNPGLPAFKILYPDFVSDYSQLISDTISTAFSLSKNGGKYNLTHGIDSSLSYIAARSHLPNRILMVFTDNKTDSNVTSALVSSIIAKAKSSNTRIVIYSTRGADYLTQAQGEYINGSNGFTFHNLAEGGLSTAIYRNMRTMFDIWNGAPLYETSIRMTADDPNFFKKNRAAFIYTYFTFFNYGTVPLKQLYER